jgi:hypothetical protein
MTITLTPEIERALTARANLHDLQELNTNAAPPDPFEGKSLADVLAGQIGTIDSRKHNEGQPSQLSTDKESFTDYLVEKRKQGQL